jgi:hypothetical protein
MADFELAALEVAAWQQMPIGESFVMDNSNGAFQELRISAELPDDGNLSFDTPVKIKG